MPGVAWNTGYPDPLKLEKLTKGPIRIENLQDFRLTAGLKCPAIYAGPLGTLNIVRGVT